MIITDLGRNSLVDANSKGLRVSITEFAVGDGHSYIPVADATNLHGNLLYRGPVILAEQINDSTIQFTCEIDDVVPVTGSLDIGELCLYTDTGILFAIGLVEPRFIKYAGVTWRTIVTLTIDVATSSTINVNTHRSMPYVAHINELDGPNKRPENTVLVGDAQHGVAGTSSVIAMRYGGQAEINEWGFTNHFKCASHVNPSVINNTAFTIPNKTFWVHDQEHVIVQVVIGDSTGQTRIYKYNDSLIVGGILYHGVFSLVGQDVFYHFDNIDLINVWRNTSNMLPSVTVDGLTLQLVDGRPVWGTSGGQFNVTQYLRRLKIVRHFFVGDGVQTTFTVQPCLWSIVSVDGVVQAQTAYNIKGDKLIFSSAPCTGQHECILFDADTDSPATGSGITVHNEQYVVGITSNPGYINSTKIQLANGPVDPSHLMVFHAHTLRKSNEYVYDPLLKTIMFNAVPYDGHTEIRWFEFTSNVNGMAVIVYKDGFIGTGEPQLVPVASTWVEQNMMVFSSGAYHELNSFEVLGGMLNVGRTVAGRKSEIIYFDSVNLNLSTVINRYDLYYPALNSLFEQAKDGDIRTDSGWPQIMINGVWRDLQEVDDPHVIEHVSVGLTSYDLEVVPRSKYVVHVNVDGLVLRYSQFSVNGKMLTLTDAPTTGAIIELKVDSYWKFR